MTAKRSVSNLDVWIDDVSLDSVHASANNRLPLTLFFFSEVCAKRLRPGRQSSSEQEGAENLHTSTLHTALLRSYAATQGFCVPSTCGAKSGRAQ